MSRPIHQEEKPTERVPVEAMTEELMHGRAHTTIRKNRYERRHPELNCREKHQLTHMAVRGTLKGFRPNASYNRRNG